MRTYKTAELAKRFNVEPGTVRSSLCLHGHYMGLRPIKLPNRLLVWNADEAEALLDGKSAEATNRTEA